MVVGAYTETMDTIPSLLGTLRCITRVAKPTVALERLRRRWNVKLNMRHYAANNVRLAKVCALRTCNGGVCLRLLDVIDPLHPGIRCVTVSHSSRNVRTASLGIADKSSVCVHTDTIT